MRLPFLLVLLLCCLAQAQKPMLGVVLHPTWSDLRNEQGQLLKSWRDIAREDIAGICDIKGPGKSRLLTVVRIHFNNVQLLTKDNKALDTTSDWGAKRVLFVLDELAKRDLAADLVLPVPKLGATYEENRASRDWLMLEACKRFPPSRLSFETFNEPPRWAKGEYDPEVVRYGKDDIAYCDRTGVHAKGYVLFGPSVAGWHWWRAEKPIAGVEAYYSADFLWKRYTDERNRLGHGQRMGGGLVVYVAPYGDMVAEALRKAETAAGLWGYHFNGHTIGFQECGIRIDLYKDHGLTEFQIGLYNGLILKGIQERVPRARHAILFDYNGASELALKGKPDRISGLEAAFR